MPNIQQRRAWRCPRPSPPPRDKILETSAFMTQDFASLKSVCANLNAFHVYAYVEGGVEERKRRPVESNYYYMRLSADVSMVVFSFLRGESGFLGL